MWHTLGKVEKNQSYQWNWLAKFCFSCFRSIASTNITFHLHNVCDFFYGNVKNKIWSKNLSIKSDRDDCKVLSEQVVYNVSVLWQRCRISTNYRLWVFHIKLICRFIFSVICSTLQCKWILISDWGENVFLFPVTVNKGVICLKIENVYVCLTAHSFHYIQSQLNTLECQFVVILVQSIPTGRENTAKIILSHQLNVIWIEAVYCLFNVESKRCTL